MELHPRISSVCLTIGAFLVLGICIGVVDSGSFSPLSGWAHLTLYQHENHNGKKYHQEVGPRCYNLPKVFDDESSSLRTHHRCVKVCVERDCRKCVEMAPGTAGHFALKEIGLNDAISSFTYC